ncbi:MAG: 4Fe-4S dicluster domain-containing protein [Oscillospiraceae bacterium]|nr:4Fe-4S dicluster domain-containing protein [Oscillospiraceae bacterium]
MQDEMIQRAAELLADGTVTRVLGWRSGQFVYDVSPALFETEDELQNFFVYNEFCGNNLSKYLIKEMDKEGKILVFLKPCDTYSFNQLINEHRIKRDQIYVIGVACNGKVDVDLARQKGIEGIISAKADGDNVVFETLYGTETLPKTEVLAERCANCKSRKHVVYDELIGEEGEVLDSHRFDMVEKIESMSPDERYAFWQGELSRCIRCNACRDVCPACTCEKCVFDNPKSGIENKAPYNSFEESMFHIIRAFHVAGRCTDCGECSRVCPENIPLHLLNRKFIKDMNTLYGPYMAGEVADPEMDNPMVGFRDSDAEPSIVKEGGIH